MEQSETQRGQDGPGAEAGGRRAERLVQDLRAKTQAEAEKRVQELKVKTREQLSAYSGVAQQRVDESRERLATQIDRAASELRHKNEGNGLKDVAGQQVAHQMAAAAGYLHQHQTEDIVRDVSEYVRQHPLRSVVAAAILGYLLGRILR